LQKSLWPHIDNTANAFEYDEYGRVVLRAGLNPEQRVLAAETLRITGLNQTPASAASFHAQGIAYDSTSKREEAWGTAADALSLFQGNRTQAQLKSMMSLAIKTGFFSIWMAVFVGEPAVRLELIKVFRASPACYDPISAAPVPRRRV
jgi:hypothetical protein